MMNAKDEFGPREASSEENHDITGEKAQISRAELPDPDAGLSEEERKAIDKKLVRQLDLKLIPWLSFLYLISFLDRTNIGNAKVDGLVDDLGMTDNPQRYGICLTVFFISYSIFEPLTNVLLKRWRPSRFIPAIMIAWGICMTCMGLVKDFGGLVTTRFFLGITEAGLFPGVNYYLSCWYKRDEFGIRAAVFFSAAAIAGSFGGLLAAAIAQMKGVGGKYGWAWIFILEGLATIVVGVISYWMVHDFPAEARFLKPDDRARVLRRLQDDKQASAHHETWKWAYFWESIKDWKTYAFAVIYMGTDGSLYAFSLFLPTIIKNLGDYSATQSNLLSVPPYVAGAIMTILVGWYADRTKRRGLCNIVMSSLGIVGFAMLISTRNPRVQYAGTFLAAVGIYPTISNTISWCSNNLEGVYKRGVSLGIVIGWGNLNGVVSSNIYRQQDAPRFLPGHGTVLGYLSVCLFMGSILTTIGLRIENKKRITGKRDIWIEGKSESEIDIMGDKRPDFLYTV